MYRERDKTDYSKSGQVVGCGAYVGSGPHLSLVDLICIYIYICNICICNICIYVVIYIYIYVYCVEGSRLANRKKTQRSTCCLSTTYT